MHIDLLGTLLNVIILLNILTITFGTLTSTKELCVLKWKLSTFIGEKHQWLLYLDDLGCGTKLSNVRRGKASTLLLERGAKMQYWTLYNQTMAFDEISFVPHC